MYCKTDVLPKHLVVVTFALPYMQPCRCSKMDLVEQNMNCCQMSFHCINFLGLDILQGVTKSIVFAVLKCSLLTGRQLSQGQEWKAQGLAPAISQHPPQSWQAYAFVTVVYIDAVSVT